MRLRRPGSLLPDVDDPRALWREIGYVRKPLEQRDRGERNRERDRGRRPECAHRVDIRWVA